MGQGKLNEALEIYRNIERKRSRTHESYHPYVIHIRKLIAYCVSMKDCMFENLLSNYFIFNKFAMRKASAYFKHILCLIL